MPISGMCHCAVFANDLPAFSTCPGDSAKPCRATLAVAVRSGFEEVVRASTAWSSVPRKDFASCDSVPAGFVLKQSFVLTKLQVVGDSLCFDFGRAERKKVLRRPFEQ